MSSSSPRALSASRRPISSSLSPAMTPSDAPIPDDPSAADALLLPMSASVMLSALPTDARSALEKVDVGEGVKVKIRFQPIGSAPQLSQRVFKISASNRFETVVSFLRRKLGVKPDESVVCYVNSVFAPGLDESVGGLFKCFKTGFQGDDQLIVAYSMTPAFG